MTSVRRALLWGAALLLFAACHMNAVDADEFHPFHCSNNAECAPGVCHRELRICTSLSASMPQYWAHVVTTPEASSPPAQWFHFAALPSRAAVLRLETPVEIAPPLGDLSGTVLFANRDIVAPGLPLVLSVYRVFTTGTPPPFSLLPGAYDVSFFADEATALPPLRWPQLHLSHDGVWTDAQREAVALDESPTEIISFAGQLRQRFSAESEISADGFAVVAVDPETGAILSTRDVTRCAALSSCGQFSILLPAHHAHVALRISRPEEPFHPDFLIDVPDVARAQGSTFFVPHLFAPLRLQGTVRMKRSAESTESAVVTRCRIHFVRENTSHADEDGVRQQLEYSATCRNDGRIGTFEGRGDLFLYPGDYRVTVFPEDINDQGTSDWSVWQGALTLAADGGDTELAALLVRRKRVCGTVVAQGQPVPHAHVLAMAQLGEPETVRDSMGVADDQGRFCIAADVGRYGLVVSPPPSSTLPAQVVSLDVTGPVARDALPIEIGMPAVVSGRVEAPDGATPALYVDWYGEFEGRAVHLWRSHVDGDASFSALLPP